MKELFKICRERSRVKYTMTVSDCAFFKIKKCSYHTGIEVTASVEITLLWVCPHNIRVVTNM